jgi:DNA-binding transcriptional MerR regulator
VTVAAVRHYHKIGLLAEPERNHSGYRSYDSAAVVRLIRIHVLASAGVPLARVEELLGADAEEFARSVCEIDRSLCREIARLQDTRRRLKHLAAGEQLALPDCVVGYLDRLRDLGVSERYIEKERDAWIMIAAQIPEDIEEIMRGKHRDLDSPDMVRLYSLIGGALDWESDDVRIIETVDILDRVFTDADRKGKLNHDGVDDPLVHLLDAAMARSTPAAARIVELLAKRGWKGWTRIERRSVNETQVE